MPKLDPRFFTYIGDGIYAEFTEPGVTLYTYKPDNDIVRYLYLGPEQLQALEVFYKTKQQESSGS